MYYNVCVEISKFVPTWFISDMDRESIKLHKDIRDVTKSHLYLPVILLATYLFTFFRKGKILITKLYAFSVLQWTLI